MFTCVCLSGGGGGQEGAPVEAKAPRVSLSVRLRGAKAGPPQLEPLTSLLERETSDSTEATARQSSFSSFTLNPQKHCGALLQGSRVQKWRRRFALTGFFRAGLCFYIFHQTLSLSSSV